MTDPRETLGEQLKRIRKERRLSQEKLAELANVGRSTISSHERDIRFPERRTLLALERALKVPAGTLSPHLTVTEPAPAHTSSTSIGQLVQLLAEESEEVIQIVRELAAVVVERMGSRKSRQSEPLGSGTRVIE